MTPETISMLKPRRLTVIPMLAAAGAVIFVFESLIPQPFPWAKLGLSNIAVLLALYFFGFREALTVCCLRVVLGGLFTGGLLSPSFVFAITGGVSAAAAMWLVRASFNDKLSPAGVSIAGAAAHNIGQIAAAYFFFIHHSSVWKLLPVMLLTSIFTGTIVGLAGIIIIEQVRIRRI